MRFFLCAHYTGGRHFVTGNREGYESREQAVESVRRIYSAGFFGPVCHSVSVHEDHPSYKTSRMLVVASPRSFWDRTAA